jgi:RNA polymerase sigma factor (sigma-70 family)
MLSRPRHPPGLEQALTEYATMVRSVGRRHGLADADLDEVMQDVRVRIWRVQGAGERFETMSSSYVYQAARSAALDLIRRRRDGRTGPLETAALSEASITPGPDRMLEREELADHIGRAVSALGSTRRPVVRMYLAGYSGNEIASVMGWSEAKARNLLYRGLADLREILTRAGIGPEGAQ